VLFEHAETKDEGDPGAFIWKGQAYRTLKCAGCNSLYFQYERLAAQHECNDSPEEEYPLEELKEYIEQCKAIGEEYNILYEERHHWPEPAKERSRPDWSKLTDALLTKLLSSVYTALEHDLRVLAAIGMRVVFDRASELVGIDTSESFANKLNQLHREHLISKSQKESLEVLTDAGSAAAHRGWEPDPKQLRILLNIMEHFVSSFVLEDAPLPCWPARPKRMRFGLSRVDSPVTPATHAIVGLSNFLPCHHAG
jgi:hypothetical protein